MRDLLVLVPDKNTEFTVRGGLSRFESLGIRPITFEVVVDPGRDGAVRRRGVQILRGQRTAFSHALMMFDYEGSGSGSPPADLEGGLDAELSVVWGRNAKAIVIVPEVDVWMWGAETHLIDVFNWVSPPSISNWLVSAGFEFDNANKPTRPKEALEAVCRKMQRPRSSAHYQKLAQRIGLARCQDSSFLRLRQSLSSWFGVVSPE